MTLLDHNCYAQISVSAPSKHAILLSYVLKNKPPECNQLSDYVPQKKIINDHKRIQILGPKFNISGWNWPLMVYRESQRDTHTETETDTWH